MQIAPFQIAVDVMRSNAVLNQTLGIFRDAKTFSGIGLADLRFQPRLSG
jgi:hypothetical protein